MDDFKNFFPYEKLVKFEDAEVQVHCGMFFIGKIINIGNSLEN